jgi:Tectonin domain
MSGTWQVVPGVTGQTFKRISVGSGTFIWAITTSGRAYRYRTTRVNPTDPNDNRLKYEWAKAPAPAPGVALANISVGMDGIVYASDAAGNIYTTSSGSGSGGPLQDPTDRNSPQIMLPWTPVPGKLTQVSVGNASLVWGLNAGGVIFRAAFTPGNPTPTWQHIQGSLKWISVAGDGSVFGVTTGNQVQKFDKVSFVDFQGKLAQISVGADSVMWGVDASQSIYQWNGRGWTKIPGQLTNVSVGADSVVYGVNQSGQVYVYVIE